MLILGLELDLLSIAIGSVITVASIIVIVKIWRRIGRHTPIHNQQRTVPVFDQRGMDSMIKALENKIVNRVLRQIGRTPIKSIERRETPVVRVERPEIPKPTTQRVPIQEETIPTCKECGTEMTKSEVLNLWQCPKCYNTMVIE